MAAASSPPELCSRFHRASELIGRRWTGAIIFCLLKSTCRFATLRDAIPEITDRMLSDRLQGARAGRDRRAHGDPRHAGPGQHALTRKEGARSETAVDAIAAWAHKWTEPDAAGETPRRTRARLRGACDPRPAATRSPQSQSRGAVLRQSPGGVVGVGGVTMENAELAENFM